MKWLWRYIALHRAVIRWVVQHTGLYLIDVRLWQRQARRLESFAAEIEAHNPAYAGYLRQRALSLRLAAAEWLPR